MASPDDWATIRPSSCECQHCEGKWLVTIGNTTKRTLNRDLAIVMAARFNGQKERPVAREDLQGLPGGGREDSSPDSAGQREPVRDASARGEEAA